jgi:hypothetical protein
MRNTLLVALLVSWAKVLPAGSSVNEVNAANAMNVVNALRVARRARPSGLLVIQESPCVRSMQQPGSFIPRVLACCMSALL